MRAVAVTAHAYGGWTGWSDSRRGIVAAATGMAPEEPFPLPAWAEHHGRDATPTGTPWGHVDVGELERLRMTLWLRGPLDRVPADRREEVRALRSGQVRDVGRRLHAEAEPWDFTPGRTS
jgi:hypothetical protein